MEMIDAAAKSVNAFAETDKVQSLVNKRSGTQSSRSKL